MNAPTSRAQGAARISTRSSRLKLRACAHVGEAESPRVLVGGLGMGYTLRATLDALPPGGHVVVAELVPAVVDWNRGPLAPLAGRPLDDSGEDENLQVGCNRAQQRSRTEADKADAEDDKDKGDAEDKDKGDAEDKDKGDVEDKDKADAEADKGEAERDAD